MHEYKHLLLDRAMCEGYLLGYSLMLTPNEYKILSSCAIEPSGLTSHELAELIANRRKPDRRRVAVHIAAINRKASKIGGRRLLVSQNGKYILNEFM